MSAASPVSVALSATTTNDASARPSRAGLRLFLAIGLLPGLYAARRLPVGLWHMAWAWAWIIGGLLLIALIAAYRQERARRVLGPLVATFAAVGLVAIVMYRLSLADSRHESLPSESWIFGLAVLLQLAVASAVLLRLRELQASRRSVMQVSTAMAAVIVAALVLVPVGRSLPAPFLVVAVGLVAARVALLPLDQTPFRAGPRRFGGQSMHFAWVVAVVGMETQTATREGGFVVVVAGLVLGLAVLAILSDDAALSSRITMTPIVAVTGIVLIGGLAVLVPSEQSAHWLHDWNFNAPATFDFAGERYEDGAFERWYDSRLSPSEAQRAAHEGLSFLVSEWAGLDPYSIDGHVWGYRLDVRIWDLRNVSRADLPRERMCQTETGTCVLVMLRRSDDLDRGPTRPLELDR